MLTDEPGQFGSTLILNGWAAFYGFLGNYYRTYYNLFYAF